MRESSFQHEFSINVWTGVIGNVFLGLHIIEGNFTGLKYLDFLQHNLSQLLNDLTQEQRDNLIFQHDGSPSYYVR